MPVGKVALEMHALPDNGHLTAEEHAAAVGRLARVQIAVDGALDHIDAAGLDRALYLPGNVWRALTPDGPSRLRTDYPAVNLMRLRVPCAGHHLERLDRRDHGRRHAVPDGLDDVDALLALGDAERIWERMCAAIDPLARLLPAVAAHRMITRGVPPTHVVDTPGRFGEIGMRVDGVLCNRDTILCQGRINALLAGGCLDRIDAIVAERGTCRILEIGPGYGALALALTALRPGRIEYVLLDLPASLAHAALYLGHFRPDHRILVPGDAAVDDGAVGGRCLFVPNYLLKAVVGPDRPIDVAINTMSMPEMSKEQVHLYCGVVRAALRPGGFFYEANEVLLPEHVDCKAILARYFPVRTRIRPAHLAVGGEVHEVWSTARIPAIHDRPAEADADPAAGPPTGPWRDQLDAMGHDALGRILAANLRGFPAQAAEAALTLASQALTGVGVPADALRDWLDRTAGTAAGPGPRAQPPGSRTSS